MLQFIEVDDHSEHEHRGDDGPDVVGDAGGGQRGPRQAMAIAIAAQAAARAVQGMGRKQVPINAAATASTIAEAQGPATRNSPAIETATNSGFFQRNGAR